MEGFLEEGRREEEEEGDQNRAIPLALPWPTSTCFL